MDLSFSDEETAFRAQVREFLRAALPEPIRERHRSGLALAKQDYVEWTRILNSRGWAAPKWPKDVGGAGWTPIQQLIFQEESEAACAPEPFGSGFGLVGPVLYTFGTPAQKARFLPRILNADDWWAQGFSEPGAGSDLAALKTAARRDGDAYVVDGQKTWTTYAQWSDWIFCLVRTDTTVKPQKGVSFLLIDMKSPGITVRPIITLDGSHEVNEVFFDQVRVPAENLVGEENRGWDYAKFLLGNERTIGAEVASSKQRIGRIRAFAAATLRNGRPLIQDDRFLEKLILLEAELKALEIAQMRVIARAHLQPQGKADPTSSILKIKGSEIQQRTTELMMEIIGPYVLPLREDALSQPSNAPPAGPSYAPVAVATYFNWRKVTIYGGSREIQRNIIAKAILGL